MNSPGKDQLLGMGSPRKTIPSPQKNKKIEIEKNQLSMFLSNLRSHSQRLQKSKNQVWIPLSRHGGVICQKVVIRQTIKNHRDEAVNIEPLRSRIIEKRTDKR